MNDNSSQFSVRLVNVDYYLRSPIPELDVITSEFRGSEIKQVPILRIFGATPQGRKTCLHIHGIFPYLYIPCEDPNPQPKLLYQIANSIDKAINISFKQTNSTSQHVYKIVLVKGIPFYGYHRKNHQFLKIYFYNPSHVKKTADLLQSGAIMGVSYQPHETHLNFVMQFFIDFNLYGMSFINLERIKHRRKSGVLIFNENMYLPDSIQCTSCCEYEIDGLAHHILNRKEILDGNSGVNPGLEALWFDERQRHKDLNISSDVTPTQSQIRDNVATTESHEYHRKKLFVKLTVNSELLIDKNESDSTLLDDSITQNNLTNKSIYPAETPDEKEFLNATTVQIHQPSKTLNQTIVIEDDEDQNFFVDEEIVSQCSQKGNMSVMLDNEDLEFVEMLKDMDDVEHDSILSSQVEKDDEEKENQEDFTEVVLSSSSDFGEDILEDDLDQTLQWNDTLKWEDVEHISQLDGSWDKDDDSQKSRKSLRLGLSRPKAQSKKVRNDDAKIVTKPPKKRKNAQNLDDLSEKFKIFQSPCKTPKKSPKKSPKKILGNYTPLSVYFKSTPSPCKTPTTSKNIDLESESQKKKNCIKKLSLRKRAKNIFHDCSSNDSNADDKPQSIYNDDAIIVSDSDDSACKVDHHKKFTASQYDRDSNFIPQPGTSRIQEIDNSFVINSSLEEENCSDFTPQKENDDSFVINSSLEEEKEVVDNAIMSFYDTSRFLDSSVFQCAPLDETMIDKVSKLDSIQNESVSTTKNLRLWYSETPPEEPKLSINLNKVVLTPKLDPPSRNEIIDTLDSFNIPRHKHLVPYYSNYKDVGNQIEIGNITLKLKSNTVEHLKDFPISLSNVKSIKLWREKLFLESNLSQSMIVSDLDTVLSNNRSCIITPVIQPPSLDSVNRWIEHQKVKHSEALEIKSDENKESEVFKLCVPNSPGQDFDNSQMEMSLSPCTPISQKSSVILTPISDDGNPSKLNKDKQLIGNTNSQGSEDSFECGQRIQDCDLDEFGPSPVLPLKNVAAQFKKKNASESYNYSGEASRGSITNDFKFSGENYQNASTHHEYEYLTLLALEVLTLARGDLNPDPQIDPICAVFYSILNDCPDNHVLPQNETGIIFLDQDDSDKNLKLIYPQIINKKVNLIRVNQEKDIFEEILNLISKWDPDILCGYEIELLSWGYIFQRAYVLDVNLMSKVSRVNVEDKYANFKRDSGDANKDIKLIGRIMLDVWRLLRHELALMSYTFENVVYHLLHERVPCYSFKTLSFWWSHPKKLLRTLSMEYYLTRVSGIIRILLQLDLIGRTSEFARVFGIQWYEVLSRGSQFRVESMMIRLTRPFNYVLISPGIQQRAAMKAPESLALILEPESRFYSDPVIVLDFQSLYPSMMIAYNYCYSTCIGKVDNMGKMSPFEFGASHLCVSPNLLKKLNDQNYINWSPCGIGFVKPTVRKGILPKMLQDILNTRFMVKKSMKKHKKDKTLQKILHNRQLGLKLIANVTYGYTAANFSGRMPCVEVGDSVVSKGRETLERAIRTIENTEKWKAKVVYGDTDSVFVLVPGRSKEEAFDIGVEIVEAVTNDNPTPVKLKLEKVYQPCILQTKKRYVGYMYESRNQEKPTYEAKGIETVRRDGCPASAKILEKSLRILFETCDVSKVKSYICRKFQNIIEGKCNIQDFIFAKEFRGMNAYKPTASVPAMEIVKRRKQIDHRYEPREGERVPYVIVNGAPGQILLQSTRSPRDLLLDSSLRLNYNYYITKAIIPPLNRCFTLIGADVNQWYAELPRKQVQLYPILQDEKQVENKKITISQYFSKVNCAGCEKQTMGGLCESCIEKPQATMLTLHTKMNAWQRKYRLTQKMCQSCCGRATQLKCSSMDCPVLFLSNGLKQDMKQIPFILQMEKKMLELF